MNKIKFTRWLHCRYQYQISSKSI